MVNFYNTFVVKSDASRMSNTMAPVSGISFVDLDLGSGGKNNKAFARFEGSDI